MYKISKRMEISGSHCLDLPYESKCKNQHGHNWLIIIYCAATDSKFLEQKTGILIDFTFIKKEIHDELDHRYLNDVFDFNPTAENIAKWISSQIKCCYKVSVQESEGNIAEYINDDYVRYLIHETGVSPL
jgi:6-pyruvoyltetrahydropterin/6-carboxytetrahydropterin synthase